MNRGQLTEKILDIKREKGWTWKYICGEIGGMSAFLAFSCIGRHWEAAARGIERELAEVYATYPTVGFQSFGEQSGMLLCNHTLTGLVIGKPRS